MTTITAKLGQCPSVMTLTYISVAINVVTLFVLFPVTMVLITELEGQRAQNHREIVPQAGNDVRISDDVDNGGDDLNRYCIKEDPVTCEQQGKQVKKTGTDGEIVCCENLGGHLTSVMSEAVQNQLQDDIIKDLMLERVKQQITQLKQDPRAASLRPAAHVGILPNENTTGPEPQEAVPRLQWDDSGEGAFLTGGVLHKGDRLTVTKPGYYYIYTGLQFAMDPARKMSQAIVAYLYRTVNGTQESQRKLITSQGSPTTFPRRRDTLSEAVTPVSMHMAGIFLLRADDEISVRTPSHSLLHRAPSTTYLGLHMV